MNFNPYFSLDFYCFSTVTWFLIINPCLRTWFLEPLVNCLTACCIVLLQWKGFSLLMNLVFVFFNFIVFFGSQDSVYVWSPFYINCNIINERRSDSLRLWQSSPHKMLLPEYAFCSLIFQWFSLFYSFNKVAQFSFELSALFINNEYYPPWKFRMTFIFSRKTSCLSVRDALLNRTEQSSLITSLHHWLSPN